MTTNPTADMAVLRLLQLVSPTLPVGAFAYSQGLEQAVAVGWVTCADETRQWICGLLAHSLRRLEVPLFKRLYCAWQTGNGAKLAYWNDWLLACRATAELRAEEEQMGRALQRLLIGLDVLTAETAGGPQPTFAAMFAAAAWHWRIPLALACTGMLWAWTENQVIAAVKLVPLGQTQGQRILMDAARAVNAAVAGGLDLADDQIGAGAPAAVLASTQHEVLHTRLFRS